MFEFQTARMQSGKLSECRSVRVFHSGRGPGQTAPEVQKSCVSGFTNGLVSTKKYKTVYGLKALPS